MKARALQKFRSALAANAKQTALPSPMNSSNGTMALPHGNQRDADRGQDPLVLVTLDRARNPEHDRLVDPVAADIQIELGVLELLDDQGLESAVHRCPRWW